MKPRWGRHEGTADSGIVARLSPAADPERREAVRAPFVTFLTLVSLAVSRRPRAASPPDERRFEMTNDNRMTIAVAPALAIATEDWKGFLDRLSSAGSRGRLPRTTTPPRP
jgi:hypothetical protein